MIMLYIKVTLIVILILVTSYIIFSYKNKKLLEKQKNNRKKFTQILERNVKDIDELTLVLIDDDNEDYKFIQAVNKIFLSQNTRIKNL